MTNPNVQDKQIKTLKQLKELAVADGGLDCYILLNGGLRSSKNIRYSPNNHRFYVGNLIDDSEQELTEDQQLIATEFALNNGLFVLQHEIGHLFVAEFELPVLGKEEDAADSLAALVP